MLDGLSGDERLTPVRVVRRMWEATADDYVHDTVQVIANLNLHWCERAIRTRDAARPRGRMPFHQPFRPAREPGWKAIEPAKADRGDDADEKRRLPPAMSFP